MWLARLYVNRGYWAKVGGVVALSLAVFLIYRFAYVAPEARSRIQAAQDINTLISQQQDQIRVARQRLANLNQTLDSARSKAPPQAEVAAKRSFSGG